MQIPIMVKNPFSTLCFERKKVNSKKDKCLEILLYVTCLFPFTNFIPFLAIGTDTQPYGVAVAVLILLIYLREETRLEKEAVYLLLLCVVMGAFAVMELSDSGMKSVLIRYITYISLFAIPVAVFCVLKRSEGLNESLIKVCIWVWFMAGLIQMTIDKDFGHLFVARQTTNAKRGIVGLATEPSAYGYVCFLLVLLVLEMNKHRLLYLGLLLIQIVVFAGSSVTLVYFGVYAVGIVLNEIVLRKRFAILKALALFGGGIGLLYFAYLQHFLPTRMEELTGYAFAGEWSNLFGDASIYLRIQAIVKSVESFKNNYGLPHGFSTSRQMSGVGILLIEGGVIAIALLFVIGRIIWKAYPKRTRFIFVFGFLIMMLSAIPFSSPIICFYIGYCMYKVWQKEIGASNEENERN